MNYVWCIMQGEDTNTSIREFFKSFLHNYEQELKIIKGSNFVFESVDLLDYKFHRVSLNRGGWYIKSPKWLENKKATVKPKNDYNDECLRWSINSALNYSDIIKKEFENIF